MSRDTHLQPHTVEPRRSRVRRWQPALADTRGPHGSPPARRTVTGVERVPPCLALTLRTAAWARDTVLNGAAAVPGLLSLPVSCQCEACVTTRHRQRSQDMTHHVTRQPSATCSHYGGSYPSSTRRTWSPVMSCARDLPPRPARTSLGARTRAAREQPQPPRAAIAVFAGYHRRGEPSS